MHFRVSGDFGCLCESFVLLPLGNFYTVCTRNDANTAYCFPTFEAATVAFATPGTPELVQETLLCDGCTQKVIWRQWYLSLYFPNAFNYTQELADVIISSEFLCQKNFNGEFCIPIVSAYNYTDLKTTCTPTAFTNCLGTPCQATLQTVSSDLGCCFRTWYDFLVYQYTYENSQYTLPAPPATLKLVIEESCAVPIPASCATQEIAAVLYISNINHTWYLEHKTEVDTLIKNTVAYVAAVDIVIITTLNAQPWDGSTPVNSLGFHGAKLMATTNPGIVTTYTLGNFKSNDAAATTQATINSNQPSNNPATTFSTSLDFNAVLDPTVPVTFSSSASLVAINGTTGSTSGTSGGTGPSGSSTAHSSSGVVSAHLSFCAVLVMVFSLSALF